jgi:hypothetical protein
LEHYFPTRRVSSRKKIVELRDNINRGVMTVEEAEALIPFERPKPPEKDIPVVTIKIGLNEGDTSGIIFPSVQ